MPKAKSKNHIYGEVKFNLTAGRFPIAPLRVEGKLGEGFTSFDFDSREKI
jgi:hypothetical protein